MISKQAWISKSKIQIQWPNKFGMLIPCIFIIYKMEANYFKIVNGDASWNFQDKIGTKLMTKISLLLSGGQQGNINSCQKYGDFKK